MLSSKQRAQLRALANPMETILQIGKNEMGENLVKQVNDALEARELIKLRVLENAACAPGEAAALLAEKCSAEVVQVIGTRFVLYRKAQKNSKIKL